MLAPLRKTFRRARGGVTLIELLLSVAITAMVALGVASMMMSVSAVAQADTEARSALMRAMAVREAVRAYAEDALCVIEVSNDGHSALFWVEDDLSPGAVNLFEMREVRFREDDGQLVLRRIVAPTGWHAVQAQGLNAAVPTNAGLLAWMNSFSALNMLEERVLVSGIADARWVVDGTDPRAAPRVRLEFSIFAPADSNANPADIPTTPMLAAFGLHQHRSPSR